MNHPRIKRRQGAYIVSGYGYGIHRCEKCGHLVPQEEEVKCWSCGEGDMAYVGEIIMRSDSYPRTVEEPLKERSLSASDATA